jgi:hypothetical protein
MARVSTTWLRPSWKATKPSTPLTANLFEISGHDGDESLDLHAKPFRCAIRCDVNSRGVSAGGRYAGS